MSELVPARPGPASSRSRGAPPRLARLLVVKFVRDTSAEFIVGDLDEAYAMEVSAAGARARYWRRAIASIWARREGGRSPSLIPEPPRRPSHRGGSLLADLRFALRLSRKSPAFSALVVLTLALGIGVNTAVFSVLNGVLLRPLPYAEPRELVNVWQIYYEWQDSDVPLFRTLAEHFNASYPVFLAWQERGHVFDDVAAYNDFSAIVEGPELAERMPTIATSAALFDVLGVQPQLGRGFTAAEDSMGAARVVVISHAVWLQRFAGDPAVLGEMLVLTGVPHTIVGVMPPGFYFPERRYQLWVPLRDSNREDRWTRQSLDVVARLRNGISLDRAQIEMDAVTWQILEDNPESPDVGIRLIGRVDEVSGSTSGTLLLLMASAGLVLAVTTANLAGLFMVRSAGRRQEIAVRRALGAGGLRLAGQLFTESFVLVLAGGVAGIVAIAGGMRWLKLLLPSTIPRLDDIMVDGRVLAFTATVSVAIALLFGIGSALYAGRQQLVDVLRAAGPGAARQRARSVLVVGEVTVAIVLTTGAVFLLGSYFNLIGADRGFDQANVLTFQLTAPLDDWGQPDNLRSFSRRVLAGIEGVPGVRSAATVSTLPFSGGQSSSSFGLTDNSDDESEAWSLEEVVSPTYFETMDVPLLRGRFFEATDTADSAKVAIINQRLAQEYWSATDPLGELVWEDGVPFTIVGVVGNNKHRSLTERVERMRYLVEAQKPRVLTSVVVRTDVDPGSTSSLIRDAVGDVSPGATISEVASLSSLVARTTALPRFRSLMLTGLALVALVLAMLGVYGVIALSVAARRREIGVRMALGAERRDILRHVLAGGARLVVPGVILGVVVASLTARLIEAYVYEVRVTDPTTFAGVAVLIAVVALLATWVPARRAARIEPLIVMRGE